jgi:hypothetical protein
MVVDLMIMNFLKLKKAMIYNFNRHNKSQRVYIKKSILRYIIMKLKNTTKRKS